jgi:hypothetical protein
VFIVAFKGNLRSYYSFLETLPERPVASDLDLLVSKLTTAITGALEASAPKLKVTNRSKRWWLEDLTKLRKESSRALRLFKRSRTPKVEID